MVRRALAFGAAVAMAALFVLVATVAPASAHAELVSSDPSDGVTVTSLPASIDLTFDESVGSPAYVTVSGPDGTVASGEATVDGTVVTQDVGAGVAGAAGTYSVSYRVVSDDGHPVTGELSFTVRESGTVQPSRTASPPTSQRSFVERHADHFVIGAVLLLAAFGLLALSRRRE